MQDRTLYSYEILVTLAAVLTGAATVFALLTEASWVADAAGAFIGVWALILVTAIPMVYLHDHANNDEYVQHH